MELGAISSLYMSHQNMSLQSIKSSAEQTQQLVQMIAESTEQISDASSGGGLDVLV